MVKLLKFIDDGTGIDVVWLKMSLAFKRGFVKVPDTS